MCLEAHFHILKLISRQIVTDGGQETYSSPIREALLAAMGFVIRGEVVVYF